MGKAQRMTKTAFAAALAIGLDCREGNKHGAAG
jgi:hypothetical protein